MNTATCDWMRGQLDAYVSRELPDETSREVARHLESCPQCAAELAARARVREQVQAAVRATAVPVGLEAKVRRAVRGERAPMPLSFRQALGLRRPPRPRLSPEGLDFQERSGSKGLAQPEGLPHVPRTGLWAVAAAAAVILSVAGVGLLRERANPEEAILRKTSGRLAALLNVGLRDHLQCAVFRKYSRQPVAAAQMAADLGPEFAALVPLIQARLPGDFRVIQGHRCTAGGRQYTHLIVAGGAGSGKLVSLILTRKLSSESLSGGIYQAGVDRFQVVGFESHGYLAYVISDLDAQQNLQWAANLAPALREYLAAHATG